jgi:hypothetical protein
MERNVLIEKPFPRVSKALLTRLESMFPTN